MPRRRPATPAAPSPAAAPSAVAAIAPGIDSRPLDCSESITLLRLIGAAEWVPEFAHGPMRSPNHRTDGEKESPRPVHRPATPPFHPPPVTRSPKMLHRRGAESDFGKAARDRLPFGSRGCQAPAKPTQRRPQPHAGRCALARIKSPATVGPRGEVCTVDRCVQPAISARDLLPGIS
jgi:hypothetical protein